MRFLSNATKTYQFNTNDEEMEIIMDSDILKAYQEKLAVGMKSGSLNINDIESLMGDAIEQFKNELAISTKQVLDETDSSAILNDCPECGRGLKKTK